MNTTKYQAIIFDMDGTLLNTIDDIGDAMNRVLAAGSFPIHPIEEYKQMVGNGIVSLVRKALPDSIRSEGEFQKYFKQFRDDYLSNWDVKTSIYPGIGNLLDKLKNKKLKLAILSNKPHNATLKCQQRFFEKSPFDIVLGQRENVPVKPDPAAAFEICNLFELQPDTVFFVGDSSVDMETGKRAGIKTIGVTWGFRSELELKNSGADFIINHPSELLLIIEG